jgi:anti-anti-sigma factor
VVGSTSSAARSSTQASTLIGISQWLDSTGLGTLVGALKRAQGRGGTVQVAAVPDRIAKQFQVTGLSRLFGIHATVGDALAVTADAETTP